MQNASARYDLPWKAALTHAFQDFMAFFFPDLHPQINWSRRPRFCDKELAGISLGATPDAMVADKLVEVLLFDGRAQWVLVHIEIQALLDCASHSEELLASHNPFAWVTLAHLRTQQARHDPD